MPDMELIKSIHRVWLELAETKSKAKKVKADLKDIAEQNDEWREVQEEIAELKNKRTYAKKLLEADKDYQVVNSELDELKYKGKDLSEILSHHLLEYYGKENATQIEDPEGAVRSIILSAKVGYPEQLALETQQD
jgi:seryl-tRNA synthetase